MKDAYRGHQTIFQLLIDAGADVSLWRRNGDDAMYHAPQHGHSAIVTVLISKDKAIADCECFKGNAAFGVAAWGGPLISVSTFVRNLKST